MKRYGIFILIAAMVLMLLPTTALAEADTPALTSIIGSGLTYDISELPDWLESGVTIDGPKVVNGRDTVNINYNFNQDQWEKLWNTMAVDQIWGFGLDARIKINFPNNASKQSVQSSPYEPWPPTFSASGFWSNNFHADTVVEYENTTAVIQQRPSPAPSKSRTDYIAWEDTDGVLHYHEVDLIFSNVGAATRIENAVPAKSHITLNKTNVTGVTTSMETTTLINYYVEQGSGNINIVTGFKPPVDNIAKVEVFDNININNPVVAHDLTNGEYEHTYAFNVSQNRVMGEHLRLTWQDGGGNDVCTQRIEIKYHPVTNDSWMENYEPLPNPQFDADFAPYLKYDASEGYYSFKPTSAALASLAGKTPYLLASSFPTPTGAVYRDVKHGEGSLHGSYALYPGYYKHAVDSLKVNKDDEQGLIIDQTARYALYDGALVKAATTPAGDTIYTTIKTEQGYANIVVFAHYTNTGEIAENGMTFVTGDLIRTQNGKGGYGVYFVVDGLEETAAIQTSAPTSYSTAPVAVLANADTGDKLVVETMAHQENVADKNFVSMDISYQNAADNITQPNGPVDVYLPFPNNMTYEQAQGYEYELYHYPNGLDKAGKKVDIDLTEVGLKFSSGTFSPFILEYKLPTSAVPPVDDDDDDDRYVKPTGTPPTITSAAQPFGAVAYVGEMPTLFVDAFGANWYQWQINRNDGKGWLDIHGATGASYTASPVTMENDGYQYRCIVGNDYGQTMSPVYTLQVLDYLAIPKTGDNSQTGLYVGLAMMGLAGMAASAMLYRRKRQD